MSKNKPNSIEASIDGALDEIETLADEIRVKLHLASMDARDVWNRDLSPRLDHAREHAKDAKGASKKAINDTLAALRSFSATL